MPLGLPRAAFERLRALEADGAAKDVTIAALQAENAALKADLERRAQVDEARWVLDKTHWTDGRLITPAEKAAAAAILNADHIARSRTQLGGR